MRLGIGSYTFTWAVGVPGHTPPRPLSALDLLDRAHQLGVQIVQFCDNLPLVLIDARDLDALEDRARSLQLAIELGTRGLAPQNLRANLRLAVRLGSPFLRLVLDSHGDEPGAEEAVSRLKPFMPEFADAGVKLALENHDRFPVRTLAWMVEQLGADQTGICLDTVNSFGALEGPEQVINVLGPYVVNVHVKDFTVQRVSHQMGFTVEGCAAGRGRLDVPWLLERLRTHGRDVNAILELWTPPAASLEATIARETAWAEESIAWLRKLIKD